MDHVQETQFFLKESVNQLAQQDMLFPKVDAFQKDVDKDKNSMINNNV